MSRIDELIERLCPNGVEWKALGDVCVLKAGKSISASDISNIKTENFPYPCMGGNGLRGYVKTFSHEGDFPIVGRQGALCGNVQFATGKFYATEHGVVVSHDVSKFNSRFLYHLLIVMDLNQYATGGAQPGLAVSKLNTLIIPTPPLEVQNEIASILDMFKLLEAELEAELEARKTQYEHYRNALLSFEAKNLKWKTLGEICKSVTSGGTPLANKSEYYSNGTIPWLRTQEVRFNEIYSTEVKITELALKQSSAKWIPANCVIVAISGATAGRSAINKIPLTTNQHCCNLNIDQTQANYRYVFHWVSSRYEQIKALGQGARADLNSGIIKSFPIAVPSIPEQEKIASILDKFDALVNDISFGLPAEIKARRQQYECYRNKLLTFKNVGNG